MAPRRRFKKIIILGDSGVGKTSLMTRFVDKKFSDQYKATIGADFLSTTINIDNNDVTLQIWDTAGQERFQSLGTSFYRGADACIIVYDVTEKKSFDNMKTWRKEFLNQAQIKDADKYPFVILGNKIDLEDKRQVDEKRTALPWCEQNGEMPHFEVSAKDSTRVDEAFKEVSTRALQREPANVDDSFEINNVELEANPHAGQNDDKGCAC